jgi:hypothetical protein
MRWLTTRGQDAGTGALLRASVGMDVLGRHEAGELRELLATKDNLIGQIIQSLNTFTPKWLAKPGGTLEWHGFMTEWNTFLAKWGVARSYAEKVLAAGNVPNEVIEKAWAGLVKALKAGPEGSAPVRGDLADFDERLSKLMGRPAAPRAVPQPTAKDTSLEILKKTDAATKQVAQVTKDAQAKVDQGVQWAKENIPNPTDASNWIQGHVNDVQAMLRRQIDDIKSQFDIPWKTILLAVGGLVLFSISLPLLMTAVPVAVGAKYVTKKDPSS